MLQIHLYLHNSDIKLRKVVGIEYKRIVSLGQLSSLTDSIIVIDTEEQDIDLLRNISQNNTVFVRGTSPLPTCIGYRSKEDLEVLLTMLTQQTLSCRLIDTQYLNSLTNDSPDTQVLDLREEINDLQVLNNSLNEEVSNLSVEISQYEDNLSSLNAEISRYQEEVSSLNTKIKELQEQNDLNSSVNTETISNLNAKILQYESEIESLSNSSLENEISQYKAKINHYEQEIVNLNAQLDINLDEEINRYENKIAGLNATITYLNMQLSKVPQHTLQEKTELTLEYTGKGKIITVYGIGSCGISTIAVTKAMNLSTSNKVLVVDMDLVCPKLEGFVKKYPFNTNLGIKNILETSGLGYLATHTVDDFLKIKGELLIEVSPTLHYLSGDYSKQFKETDFTLLFNNLGNEFDYIVLDLGKMTSKGQDEIISMFNKVSHKDICVVPNKLADIKLLRLACKNLDLSKMEWVLNYSKRTELDETSKKILGDIPYSIIQFDSSFFGSNKLLNEWTERSV